MMMLMKCLCLFQGFAAEAVHSLLAFVMSSQLEAYEIILCILLDSSFLLYYDARTAS